MKNRIYNLLFIIVVILSISIVLLYIHKKEPTEYENDLTIVEKIGEKEIDVTYIKGNMIDTTLTFGNTYEKIIKITNNNSTDLVVAINLEDLNKLNEYIKYNIYYQTNETDEYDLLKEDANLDNKLVYNLIIKSQTNMNIKIVIRSLYEEDSVNIKGRFKVTNNLSSKDIFISKANEIHANVLNDIQSLNGITEPGIYLKKIETSSLNGYVLIDARDISELKYVYTLQDGFYILNNYKYKNKFKKSSLQEKTSENQIDENQVCNSYSKKECRDFNTLSYNNSGGKELFKEKIDKVVFDLENKTYEEKVYIIDANTLNIENIRGYVLINNKETKKEIYLYLTNDLFMISGYNLTKLGKIDIDSSTIRAYNESAFNLSSKDMKTVCNFTGFDECYDLNNQLV